MKHIGKKKNLIWIMWLAGIVAILFSTAGMWYRPLPKVQVKECTDLDEKAAYDYVDEITEVYPYRTFGSSAVQELGDNIGQFFEQQGLEVEKQEFVSWRPDANKFYLKFDLVDNDVNLFSDSYDTLVEHVKGTNIIGISQGESNQAILIGAHRDMAYGVQGAEDNASGTGLLMELAKELCSDYHYYTYIFVSFDGEEAQEKGSDYFVKQYHNIDSVKLAIILDQVGFREADSLMTYGKYGGFEQLSLGTQSLLKACLDVSGEENVSFDPVYAPKKGIEALIKHIEGKCFITANTDCNPFYDKQIPAFGVKAINAKKMEEAIVHSPNDNMENISSETIKMSGNFVKTMVATVEAEQKILSSLSEKDDFIISGDSYLPSVNMMIARIILFVLIGLEMFVGVWSMNIHSKKEEVVLGISTCGASLVLACVLCCLIRYGLSSVLKRIPVLGVVFVWILLLIGGIVAIKKVIVKNHITGLSAISLQKIVNGVAFGILFLEGNEEYAVVLLFITMIGTFIMQFLGEKFKAIGIITNVLYVVIHSYTAVLVFGVFLRGVDMNSFLLIHIISLFVFVTMNVLVFGRKSQPGRLNS